MLYTLRLKRYSSKRSRQNLWLHYGSIVLGTNRQHQVSEGEEWDGEKEGDGISGGRYWYIKIGSQSPKCLH